jgi:hypothetical protein
MRSLRDLDELCGSNFQIPALSQNLRTRQLRCPSDQRSGSSHHDRCTRSIAGKRRNCDGSGKPRVALRNSVGVNACTNAGGATIAVVHTPRRDRDLCRRRWCCEAAGRSELHLAVGKVLRIRSGWRKGHGLE